MVTENWGLSFGELSQSTADLVFIILNCIPVWERKENPTQIDLKKQVDNMHVYKNRVVTATDT